ncbi:MAG: AAA family ATPase [Chloroflexota bacterium]|nr:AAA family ATPase [Chloroflexota bacterium]
MIILKHLTVERFRLLREVDLHFPQRGSILIQGANEAGKSTLFESIYFALYGEPLASDRERRTLDDLILYGETQASVTLTLSIGVTEMTITRTIERGKGQRVALSVRRLGMPDEEPITRLNTANERIITELGYLDGSTLRNSCFIEQKGLTRLEHLNGHEREVTLRKLLGLEKLTRLAEQFKLTPADELQLSECSERLKLAEIQARIPELSEKLGQLEASLDAVAITGNLAEVGQQEVDIDEQERALERLRTRRVEIKARQGRIQQLKRADATLGEISAAYDAMAKARHEIPELDRQIAELERREREELPTLAKRVQDLEDLTHSFGTLERMAADLLTAVNTIKELEQEIKEHKAFQENVGELDTLVAQARARVAQIEQAQRELEERRRSGRPNLEARLRRLQGVIERLKSLHDAEEQYIRNLAQQAQAQENAEQIEKMQKELQETEQELALAENEARQVQQQAEARERRWRQLNLARQLEEWQRLKGLLGGLTEANQHLEAAYQYQFRLSQEVATARQAAMWRLLFIIGGVVLCVLFAIFGFIGAQQGLSFLSIVPIILAIACAGAAVLGFVNYKKAQERLQVAQRMEQEAKGRVGMMVAAREAAARVGGGLEALQKVEHEIRALGGNPPRSVEEAQYFIEQVPDRDESIVDVQKRMTEARDNAAAARNQVNVTLEAVAALRRQHAQLEEERQNEGWEDINGKIRAALVRVEQVRHDISALMGQEGLPIPTFESAVFNSAAKHAELKAILDEAIQGTEREIASIDGRFDLMGDLQAQLAIYQADLNALLARQQTVMSRQEQFQTHDPEQQVARARAQQMALRDALRALQDSLRLRVKPLGVAFGQAAISSAETSARKELEALDITLGRRVELEARRSTYVTTLKERQDSLAGHYQQLAKFSATLGSWVVPPNPFAETLATLRDRCQQELEKARESTIMQELDNLQAEDGASHAKIELCRQEIEEARERIAALLAQRHRPAAREHTLEQIVIVWPLVGERSLQDRAPLEAERQAIEQELQQLEQRELQLSKQLQTGGTKLDLEEARRRMEQQERSYQTKKRGNLLVSAVTERLMRKMIPRIEYYVQQVLPLLTSGRYHDVQLTTEEEEHTASGGRLQLRVWDSAAAEYMPRSALSGGAADQVSLALRLAFAIAALPRELGAAPGFLLLDEPLSSFDLLRMQALIDVVTGETLGQHFEQILFVSHNSAFDPAMFPYHIYVDNGLVVESNLPVVPNFPKGAANENLDTIHAQEGTGQEMSPITDPVAVES